MAHDEHRRSMKRECCPGVTEHSDKFCPWVARHAECDKLREALEKIYPTLPSYLGKLETPDNPCLRRIADEALAK